MNLHDWIDELCDVLDIEAEADEALLLDLAMLAHDQVHAAAGPVTAFLLGVAAGERGSSPEEVERLAARAQALAEAWDRPAGAVEPDGTEVFDGIESPESVDGAELDEVDEVDAEESFA